MGLKIFYHHSREQAVIEAGKALQKALKGAARPLLLLSGGSSLNAAKYLFRRLSAKAISQLELAQIDDNFVAIDDFYADCRQIKEAPIPIDKVRNFHRILEASKKPQEIAANYSALLEILFEKADAKVGLYGIKPDGTFGGIKPQKREESFTKFLDGRWVVSYKAPDFTRITTTDSVISALDKVILFAAGKDKAEAIMKLDQDIQPRLHPAQLLKDAKDAEAHVYIGR